MINVKLSIDEMLELAAKHENPSKIVLDALKSKTESNVIRDLRTKVAEVVAP